MPNRTFADRIAPVVARCKQLIEQDEPKKILVSPEWEILWLLDPGGELWPELYPNLSFERSLALEILWRLDLTQSADSDQALWAAWKAGRCLALAEMRALSRIRMSKAARAKAEHALERSRAHQWRAEIDTRRPGLSQAAVHRHIEKRDGLKPGTVKKALTRAAKVRK